MDKPIPADDLTRKHCFPCEGGMPPLSVEEVRLLLSQVHGWSLADDGKRIARRWSVQNFPAAIAFFNKVADLAEQEGHHPDLHLEGYRQVAIELTTHAIQGISENDLIMAAKINQIPIALQHPANS